MRILNLGAGVQSTAVFLMSHEGLIEPIDYAIFADTQEEPRAVYEHLAWLKRVPAPVPIILTGTVGRIGDDLSRRETSKNAKTGKASRFATIPAYTAPGEPIAEVKEALAECPESRAAKRRRNKTIGKLRRQCTKEYKTEVVERIIRREIFQLKPRGRFPKGTRITQLFGISLDEKGRAVRIRARIAETKYAVAAFPLLDLKMTRQDCMDWLKSRVPHETPRSACVFCPYKSAEEWKRTQQDPEAWARAVEVDANLRKSGVVAQRQMNQPIYVHRTAVPLPMVDLDAELVKERDRKRRPLFDLFECGEGMCGN